MACVEALPAAGGVCDARDLPSGGTIPSITIDRSGVTILGPCGQFNLTGTLNIYNPAGLAAIKWEGCGATASGTGTVLTWRGNATDPAIRIRGVRDSIFSDFGVNSSSNFPLATTIQLETATGTTSTHRTFRNIVINGTNAGGLQKGFRWCTGDDCGGAGPDGNNDMDRIEGVQVISYSNCAYSIEGTQSKAHLFTQSFFAGNGVGQRGVCTTQAANSARNSGSFHWEHGAGGGNTVADFDIGNPNDTITIRDFNLEGSARLLQTGPANSSPMPITISGGRWDARKIGADNIVILYQWRGPLTLIGNNFGGAPMGATPSVNLTSSGPSFGAAIGNSISWNPVSSNSQPFIGTGTWDKHSNVITDNAGNTFPVP